MKVQYFGGSTFAVEGKEQKFIFNATEAVENMDLALSSDNGDAVKGAQKTFGLPGEFEISNILLRGFRTENGTNTVFKAFAEETSFVHFGNLTDLPKAETLKGLGENIDVAFVVTSEKFDAKKVKMLIEAVEPRLVIVGGDAAQFSVLAGLTKVEMVEENPLKVEKSKLSDEITEVKILSV